jgi:hypothetical protein
MRQMTFWGAVLRCKAPPEGPTSAARGWNTDARERAISTRFEVTLLGSISDAGAQSPYLPFKERLAHRMHTFLKADAFGVMTAETVARTILKAATAKRPRTRYSVGFIACSDPSAARWHPTGSSIS